MSKSSDRHVHRAIERGRGVRVLGGIHVARRRSTRRDVQAWRSVSDDGRVHRGWLPDMVRSTPLGSLRGARRWLAQERERAGRIQPNDRRRKWQSAAIHRQRRSSAQCRGRPMSRHDASTPVACQAVALGVAQQEQRGGVGIRRRGDREHPPTRFRRLGQPSPRLEQMKPRPEEEEASHGARPEASAIRASARGAGEPDPDSASRRRDVGERVARVGEKRQLFARSRRSPRRRGSRRRGREPRVSGHDGGGGEPARGRPSGTSRLEPRRKHRTPRRFPPGSRAGQKR